MSQLSIFMMLIWAMIVLLILRRRTRRNISNNKAFIPALSFLLFPIGFFLVNFEARYIWYMMPLGMLLGALMIEEKWQVSSKYYKLIPIVFALSFIAWPVWDIRSMWNEGKKEAELAGVLKSNGFNGSYTGNVTYGDEGYTGIQRLAYYTNTSYYHLVVKDVSFQQLLKEMRRYHVQYFLLYKKGSLPGAIEDIKDEVGRPFPQLKLNATNVPFDVFYVGGPNN